MKNIEVEGKTVTMAVEKGLAELGLRRDQVEVQVLQEANPGFLGIGAKLAKVRITEKLWGGDESRPAAAPRPEGRPGSAPRHDRPPVGARPAPRRHEEHRRDDRREDRRPATRTVSTAPAARGSASSKAVKPLPPPPPPDPAKACEEAKAWLDEVLKAMGVAVNGYETGWDAAQLRARVEIDTPDAQLLIGKDGRTLESLQFLTTLIVSRRLKTPVAVQVETASYWKQKEESILTQVHQAIEEVKRTGRLVRLQPMEASLRRMVHRALAESPDVETVSEGEGVWRKVVLRPKKR